MRSSTPLQRHVLALAAGLSLALASVSALADPPGRVARLGYVSGAVSFSPAGDDDWATAAMNRPLTTGDRLWADTDGRAELQVGGASLRLTGGTAVSILNLDDDIVQLQLTEGSMNVRVRHVEQGQSVEVDTPHLAFILREPGAYRIDVDPDGNATTVRMREGRGEVSGENASYLLDAPQVQRFVGDAQRDQAYASAPVADDFDRWADDRDVVLTRSVSARYVAPDMIGYADLDANGSWSVGGSYGNVWVPSRVPAGWAPYRDGHWAWVDPWGWTWIDDAPWGFAVSHYGRWANVRSRWVWVPGPARVRATYAPALVAFVGGPNFSLSISSGGSAAGVAWFPLGPRDVYRPAYKVTPNYFERINVSNTVVDKTVIRNVYVNKTVTNITYVNQRVPGAVVAVPQKAFVESQPVAKVVVKAPKTVIEAKVVVAEGPHVAPTVVSLRGGSDAVGRKPPPAAFTRTVVARSTPPPRAPSFAAQQQRLAAQPGRPLDDDDRKQIRAAAPAQANAAAPAPAVKVVAAKATSPQQLPAREAKVRENRPADERVAGAAAAASRPESKSDADRQAAADKADKSDRGDKSERPTAAASSPRERNMAAAERARGAASANRGQGSGSESEAMDAVAEAQRRAPPAAGRASQPTAEERGTAREAPRRRESASAPRATGEASAEAASAARPTRKPRPDAAATSPRAEAGTSSPAADRPAPASREDKRAARAAKQAERRASAAGTTRPPPATAAADRPSTPAAPGEPTTTARTPKPQAPAASHPKGKKRGEEDADKPS